jgi:hypothetical protein
VPAALQKIPVLGGRGVIIEYANRPGKYFYRELVEGCRRYRSILIKNARTVKEAEDLAIDAYGLLRQAEEKAKVSPQVGAISPRLPEPSRTGSQQPKKNSDSGLDVATAIEDFLQAQQEKLGNLWAIGL